MAKRTKQRNNRKSNLQKRISRKRLSRKRLSRKRTSRKRLSRKRISRKRLSRKRTSKRKMMRGGAQDAFKAAMKAGEESARQISEHRELVRKAQEEARRPREKAPGHGRRAVDRRKKLAAATARPAAARPAATARPAAELYAAAARPRLEENYPILNQQMPGQVAATADMWNALENLGPAAVAAEGEEAQPGNIIGQSNSQWLKKYNEFVG